MTVAHTDVLCWGVSGVLQRLTASTKISMLGEGANGTLDSPSVCCDAPLVGLHLALRGRRVNGAFTHPGRTPMAEALSALLLRYMSIRFGPWRGDPFSVSIRDSDGHHVLWCSDQRAALLSLVDLSVEDLSADWLYYDAYRWLTATRSRVQAPIATCGYFVNLGALTEGDIPLALEAELAHLGEARVIFQISVPAPGADLAGIAGRVALRGDLECVLTSASRGFAVVSGRKVLLQEARQVEGVIDSSGAGASLSAALIDALLRGDSLVDPNVTLQCAEYAAAHCGVLGNVPHGALSQWECLLEAANISAAW